LSDSRAPVLPAPATARSSELENVPIEGVEGHRGPRRGVEESLLGRQAGRSPPEVLDHPLSPDPGSLLDGREGLLQDARVSDAGQKVRERLRDHVAADD
jgi:hypothetical protein